jgi:type II secretory pathway predicted ATPase ExeA
MHAETNPPQQPAHVLEDLMRIWGLHRAPFSADDKCAQIFPAAWHSEALELLHTTAALRGLMLLTGNPGTGKSTLLKSWIASLEPKRFLPPLITQSSLSATGVLEVLLAELEPVTLVLILDDAQNYPAPALALEELRLLLGTGGRRRSAMAMTLLGDDYLLGSLRLSVHRALFTRISATARLVELPLEDIPGYLKWHMSRAGLDRDIFAPAATDMLAEASEGNPRILGLLAQAAWIAAARSGSLTIQADHVHKALRQVPAASAKIQKP